MPPRLLLTLLLASGLLPLPALGAPEPAAPQTREQAQSRPRAPTAVQTAVEAARKTGRDVLVVFDASEMGTWCDLMRRDILNDPSFAKGVSGAFVTVVLDHSRKDGDDPEERRLQNAFERRLGVTGFPSVLLLDGQGRAYARTGYRGSDVPAYIAHLTGLRALRERRDALIAKSRRNSGYIRAEHLANALRTIDGSLAAEYDELFEELRATDPADKRGVLLDYDLARLAPRAREAARAARHPAAGLRVFDDFLAQTHSLPDDKRQRVLHMRFDYLDKTGADGLSRMQRCERRLQELRAMLALAPDSPVAPRIRKLIEDEEDARTAVLRAAVEAPLTRAPDPNASHGDED